jgi:hypothetical protein
VGPVKPDGGSAQQRELSTGCATSSTSTDVRPVWCYLRNLLLSSCCPESGEAAVPSSAGLGRLQVLKALP